MYPNIPTNLNRALCFGSVLAFCPMIENEQLHFSVFGVYRYFSIQIAALNLLYTLFVSHIKLKTLFSFCTHRTSICNWWRKIILFEMRSYIFFLLDVKKVSFLLLWKKNLEVFISVMLLVYLEKKFGLNSDFKIAWYSVWPTFVYNRKNPINKEFKIELNTLRLYVYS